MGLVEVSLQAGLREAIRGWTERAGARRRTQPPAGPVEKNVAVSSVLFLLDTLQVREINEKVFELPE